MDGNPVTTGARIGTGQMLIPVHAGMNRVEIVFTRTWDRATGGWISLLTFAGVILWMMFGDVRRVRLEAGT